MHDHRVGRGADHRREAVVVEEVRAGATPVEHLAGHPVDLGGRDPGADGGPGGLVDLGHHPPGLAHLGQLLGGASHQNRPPRRRRSSTALTIRRVTASGVPVPGHRSAAGSRSRYHSMSGAVWTLVELEPAADGLFGVVLALDHLAAADVAGPVDQRGRRERVVGAAVDAHPPGGQPPEHLGWCGSRCRWPGRGRRERGATARRLGLGHRARAAVEHEPPGPDVALAQAIGDHLHDQVVAQQLAPVHLVLGLHAERRCPA